jgi:streptogramin lyase
MVRKIDGDNGTMIDEVLVPNWEGNWGHGTYGGAADADGAFWGLGTLGTLITIDPDLTGVTTHVNPVSHVMYGIALDANGDPWLAGYGGKIWWFDRLTETFNDMGDSNDGPSRFRGLAIDSDGHAWLAGNDPCGLTRYDTINRVLVDSDVGLSDCEEPVGVSIDVDGKVWVVDRDAEVAYRVDPDDYSATITVGNLVNPYTYSDMTGAGLNLVINPPG